MPALRPFEPPYDDETSRWGVHVTALGAHVGFTKAQIMATVSMDAGVWSDRERLLIRLVDALCDGSMDAETLMRVRATWSQAEQLEIASLVGFYHTISNIVALAELAPEPWAERLPDQERQRAATEPRSGRRT